MGVACTACVTKRNASLTLVSYRGRYMLHAWGQDVLIRGVVCGPPEVPGHTGSDRLRQGQGLKEPSTSMGPECCCCCVKSLYLMQIWVHPQELIATSTTSYHGHRLHTRQREAISQSRFTRSQRTLTSPSTYIYLCPMTSSNSAGTVMQGLSKKTNVRCFVHGGIPQGGLGSAGANLDGAGQTELVWT